MRSIDQPPKSGDLIRVIWRKEIPDTLGVFQTVRINDDGHKIWRLEVGNQHAILEVERRRMSAWALYQGNYCAECESPVEEEGDYLCVLCRHG